MCLRTENTPRKTGPIGLSQWTNRKKVTNAVKITCVALGIIGLLTLSAGVFTLNIYNFVAYPLISGGLAAVSVAFVLGYIVEKSAKKP